MPAQSLLQNSHENREEVILMNVIVTAYNPNWPALYEQEAQAIRQIL